MLFIMIAAPWLWEILLLLGCRKARRESQGLASRFDTAPPAPQESCQQLAALSVTIALGAVVTLAVPASLFLLKGGASLLRLTYIPSPEFYAASLSCLVACPLAAVHAFMVYIRISKFFPSVPSGRYR